MKLSVWFFILVVLAVEISISGEVLFDGQRGTLPGEQGWSYASFPGLAQQTTSGAAVRLNTTAANMESAGYARIADPVLNLSEGYGVAVRFQLAVETHTRNERAGFSLLILSDDKRGLELAFWTNGVFAQGAKPLFSHAEEAGFNFSTGMVQLVVILRGTNYTLHANGTPLLTGPVRDYTAFTGFPDVYETPNFLFLGDDTTSAAGDVTIESVALVRPPKVSSLKPGWLQWAGVAGLTYSIESSIDLQNWSRIASATSVTEQFEYTNAPTDTVYFYRVTYP